MITTTSPRLYVGTFAKYNSGSIKGDWIDLEGHDKESFLEACRELHLDESDPEFMFQDYEGFPKSFYSESYVPSILWDWIDASESDREVWNAYAEAVGLPFSDTTLEQAQDAFVGEFNSIEDFSEQTCEDCENLSSVPDYLRACIDWKAVWNSALRFDYTNEGSFFFRSF
jgi:antirestriction protein